METFSLYLILKQVTYTRLLSDRS